MDEDKSETSNLYQEVKQMLKCVALLNSAIQDENCDGCIFDIDDSDYEDNDSGSEDNDSGSEVSTSGSADCPYLSVLPVVQYFIRKSGVYTKDTPWQSFLEQSKSFHDFKS